VYKDLGKPYQSYWYSKTMEMDDPTSFKQFREFYVVAQVYETSVSTINFKFEIDNVDVDDKSKLTNQNSVWGKSKFGDRFINRNIIASLPIIIGRRGRTLKFKLSNGYFQTGSVATYTDLLVLPGIREGMLYFVTDTSKYYLYTDLVWTEQTSDDLYQPMKFYEVSGQYEFRGKR
jgi:hypothetical protein